MFSFVVICFRLFVRDLGFALCPGSCSGVFLVLFVFVRYYCYCSLVLCLFLVLRVVFCCMCLIFVFDVDWYVIIITSLVLLYGALVIVSI